MLGKDVQSFMDDYAIMPGPGKTPPRLIIDLLDYDPRRRRRDGWNVLAHPSPQFKDVPIQRRGPQDCRHVLMKKVAQTTAPSSPDELPNESTKYVVATYCTSCYLHFRITVDYTPHSGGDGRTSCRLSDAANPMHHLRLVRSTSAREYAQKKGVSKYNSVSEGHLFMCSGEKCHVQVNIEISAPKLGAHLRSLVLDPVLVEARGRKVIKEDPERYTGMSRPLKPIQVLLNLRQYLIDARSVQDPTQRRKIAKRNKRFILGFDDSCNPLFEYLDFVTVEEASTDPDEPPNSFWQLPQVTETNRDFVDDVLVEIESMIKDRPEEEQTLSQNKITHIPLNALKDIGLSLGCHDYPRRNRTVDLTKEEHPYFASLGTVSDVNDDLLSWAYDRQCECDPENKPYYLDCLEELASGRNSPDLETKVVMAQSAGEVGQKAIDGAYRFLGLEPGVCEGDEHIIGLYKSRIESAPRQKSEAKDCLLVLAKARDSDKIRSVANDNAMSFREALEFLNVPEDAASDSIEAAAIALAFDADKSRVAAALRVIANQRGHDFTLQRAASAMGTGESVLDINEAYNRLQIYDRNAPDETVFAYFTSLSAGAPAGSKDSYTEALRVIAFDRQSSYLLSKLDNPDAEVLPAATDQPVGLDNIGNTCYLNSLLQYYYTIKAVRDVVMDFQHHRMPLSQEYIKKKRVGGRAVAKAEITKAQKFVDELHNLFENLKTASSRSIKPTRELAELTIFSSAAEANFRRASISSPGPPNLVSMFNGPVFGPEAPPPTIPIMASSPSTVKDDYDIEMVDRPDEKQPQTGDDDDSSEATLVDLDPLPPIDGVKDEEPVEVESVKTTDLAQEEDAVMVNGDTNTTPPSVPETPSTPERPPPVPPRNKSGLVISTDETKEKPVISDDELWKFGSQQDVTEVIGNVMFRLQCAIKPTSIDEATGEQIDSVRDTFFGANAVYNRKAQVLEKKVEAWANLIVFPPPTGSRDIYEALDVVFDEQIVEIGNVMTPQHTSIAKLPPILQIQIQRTAYDPIKQSAWKNRNPVLFPETVYLDRYMDSEENSPLMRRRRETWEWKSKLRVLEARLAALKNEEGNITVPEALAAAQEYITDLQAEGFTDITIDPSLPHALSERIAAVAAEMSTITTQIAALKHRLSEQFTDMRSYEYKLQTVFIHRGEAGGGHYWIYIYDFANDVWREYNDEYVTVVKDRRRIFEHQAGPGGTPYYLAYVRSADKDQLVEAVCREVVSAPEMTEKMAVDEAVVLSDETGEEDDRDGEENGLVRHVEHAKPRPLRPKPADANHVGEGNGKGVDGKFDGSGWNVAMMKDDRPSVSQVELDADGW